MRRHQLVDLARARLEAEGPPLQRIDNAGQITVVMAGTIDVGEGILAIEGVGLGTELRELTAAHLGSRRHADRLQQQAEQDKFAHGQRECRTG